MRSLYFLPYVLLTSVASAQFVIDWSHPATDRQRTGVMAATDSESNLIVTGYRSSFIGDAHIFTRKFNSAGDLLWETVDQTGLQWKFERPTWIGTNSTNDVFVTGYKYAGTSNIIADTAVVLKYNSAGQLIWKREIARGWTYGVRGALDEAGNIYVGLIGVTPSGFSLVKFDGDGQLQFDVSDQQVGGSALSMVRVKNGVVVVAGVGPGTIRAPLRAWSTTGEPLWSTVLRGNGAVDVQLDDDGNCYVLTDSYDPFTSVRDMVIKKLDAAGDSLTQFEYDFNGTDLPSRMVLVNSRITVIGANIQIGGAYMDWITFQIGLDGELLWSARYNGMVANDEKPSWVEALPTGEVYVSGQGGPSAGQASWMSYVVVKYDTAGQVDWTHTDPYFGYVGVSCVVAPDEALYVLGQNAMTATRYRDDLSNTIRDSEQPDALNVYPNPFSDHLRMELDHDRIWRSVELLSTTGQVIHAEVPLQAGTWTRSTAALAPGTYVLRVCHDQGCQQQLLVKDRP
jgi:hypothetical protein